MEQEIYLKQKKFEKEYDNFLKKIAFCIIVVRLMGEMCKKTEESHVYLEDVKNNLKIFTESIQHCCLKVKNSLEKLVSNIKNGLPLFTYNRCDLQQYKPNTIGECIIVEIGDFLNGQCYINDSRRPKPLLHNNCMENLTKFPESGEIFAVRMENEGFYRAVRSDLIFQEQSKIIIYLLDIGKQIEVPYNLQRFYSLPIEYREMEACAIHCNVVRVFGKDGIPLEVGINLQNYLNKSAYFQVKQLENDILWITLCLKETENQVGNGNETAVVEKICNDYETRMEKKHTTLIAMENSTDLAGNYQDTTQISEFICDICQTNFSTKMEIEAHMKLHIPQQIASKSKKKAESHLCEFCGNEFVSAYRLKIHLRIHNGEKPYKCSICGTRFAYKKSLLCHVVTHNITCKWCDASFSNINELEAHIKNRHNIEAFVCHTCGKMHKRKRSLAAHLHSHTKEKSYPCEKCGKIFFNKWSQKSHLTTHSAKKFPCKLCSKTFGSKFNLNRHLNSHLCKKPFTCKFCKKSFTSEWSLKMHVKIYCVQS